jgi:hypothetical protein
MQSIYLENMGNTTKEVRKCVFPLKETLRSELVSEISHPKASELGDLYPTIKSHF